ncbi:magnesium transporter CorA [Terriglobus albidus]|uniref:Magnesium transport protein CorA n=1 Tax=Terriglobus albidus TaxID=1592106 RepID=A0A5B9E7V5_9BACT|nr:magnesium transporter CorA family protein [Terriglobus albidus]QEE28168.1 magnesium transporter CorA [Terriglobus albidus]
MLRSFHVEAGRLRIDEGDSLSLLQQAAWIDLLAPTPEEDHAVEHAMALSVPTREEMSEVESSSNLYRESGASYITVRLVSRPRDQQPKLAAVTMIVTARQFVTLRYADPTAFKLFCARVDKSPKVIEHPRDAVLTFLETVVDRVADILEEIGNGLDVLAGELFAQDATSTKVAVEKDLAAMLRQIGRSGDLAGRARESLLSLTRAAGFLSGEENGDTPHQDRNEVLRLKTLQRDIKSLLEHDAYLLSQIQFLLDSNLGMISIQQNAIIKILSVAAVIFLPPTLVGSLYGMNFEHMPELKWHLGYPMAIVMMVLSAVLPYWYFRRRGWL